VKIIKLHTPKRIIGRQDILDLPALNLRKIACKIDSGAFTSAIHCHHIFLKIFDDGSQELSFRVLDPTHKAYNSLDLSTKNFKEKIVKSSFGEEEFRYVITTTVVLFGKKYETEFTLADRMEMRFPVLLGRKILNKIFLVDVSKKDLSFKRKRKKQIKKNLNIQKI
jgi:hypothetical protein